MEHIASIVVGVLLPAIVSGIDGLLAKKGIQAPTGWILAGLCLLVGIVYTAYSWITPGVVQEQVAVFASSSIGTAVLVYELLLKKNGLDSK